jgi:hypothetical protein
MMEACQPLYSSKLSFRRATNQGRSLSRSSRQEGRGGRGTHPSHAASTCGLPHGCHGVMTSLLASRLGGLFRGLVAGETVQRPSQSSRGGKNGPVATQACPSETGPIFDAPLPRLVAAVEAHRAPARAWLMTLPSWKGEGAQEKGGAESCGSHPGESYPGSHRGESQAGSCGPGPYRDFVRAALSGISRRGRGSLFASAGLWERWWNPKAEVVQIFTILAILTTTPNEVGHNRMPVDPGARGMADLAWRGRGDHRSVARHPATASDQEDALTRLTGEAGMSATMTPHRSGARRAIVLSHVRTGERIFYSAVTA